MSRNIFFMLLIGLLLVSSCSEDNDDNLTANTNISFKFIHNWNGQSVTNADFNTIQFTTENGEMLSIERLRYLISDITFSTSTGENFILDNHYLIDVTNDNGLSFTLNSQIPNGDYNNVSFTFGFNNEDNSQNYVDLNSASFNVPEILGGGYHYMQFDGKFINSNMEEQGFNYHAIRAVDNPGDNPTFPQDTFFIVNLGAVTITNNTEIHINADLSNWFKNPNLWDLNTYNQMLMPNSAAQILMYENGQDVFSLGEVAQ